MAGSVGLWGGLWREALARGSGNCGGGRVKRVPGLADARDMQHDSLPSALMRVDAYQPIVARQPIAIRAGTSADLPFIDRLQKQQSREVGFLPMMALEGKVKLGQVLIAEKLRVESREWRVEEREDGESSALNSPLSTANSPLGYLIAADRYQKRDELGYVTQINVLPEYRRSLVAGQLLQAQFDRSAYGCRLYCCWCAQDLKANEFWEAMGFTAIAFRTGSMTRGKKLRVESGECRVEEGKDGESSAPHAPLSTANSPLRARVHIFWQKRVRAGDATTPWWYPSQTGGGVIRADRLVFPIPTGVHWKDVGAIELASQATVDGGLSIVEKTADGAGDISTIDIQHSTIDAPRSKRQKKAPPPVARPPVSPRARGGFWAMQEGVPDTFKTQKQLADEAKAARRAERSGTHRSPRATAKAATHKPVAPSIDPRLTAMSRELRDQWAERADTIVSPTLGKHDVKRIAQASTLAREAEPSRLEQAA